MGGIKRLWRSYVEWVRRQWERIPYFKNALPHKEYAKFLQKPEYKEKRLRKRVKEAFLTFLFTDTLATIAILLAILLILGVMGSFVGGLLATMLPIYSSVKAFVEDIISSIGLEILALVFILLVILFFIFMVLSVALTIIRLAVEAVFVFIILKMLGGKAGLKKTFNALLLPYTALSWVLWPSYILIIILPLLGVCIVYPIILILGFYNLYCATKTLSHVHKTKMWKAALALILYIVAAWFVSQLLDLLLREFILPAALSYWLGG